MPINAPSSVFTRPSFGAQSFGAQSVGSSAPGVLGSAGMGFLGGGPAGALISGGAALAGTIFTGKGANKSRDKQLAYAKEQDAYDRARQAEIDAAEKAQVAQQNAYASAHQTYVSDYNKWRMKYITGDTKEPPPTFNFDYNGMVPPSAPASRSSIGSLASDAPAPVQNALASPQMTPDTLGAIAQKTPWDWGSGDPRAARKVPSQTLSSLAGRY